MAQIQEDLIEQLTREFKLDQDILRNTVTLLEDGASVSFVARYRKARTGGMKEAGIREVMDRYLFLAEFNSRRRMILKNIRKLGSLTPELEERITACVERAELEDFYLAFKPRKKGPGQEARDKGLEPFANEFMSLDESGNPQAMAERAASTLGDGMTLEVALESMQILLAEKVSEHPDVRGKVRNLARNEGNIVSRVKEGKEEEVSRFQNYYAFTEKLCDIPAHRMLALRRGEKEGYLDVRVEFDREAMLEILRTQFPAGEEGPGKEFMEKVFQEAADHLLGPSIANEVRAEAKRMADHESIQVFCENLREILLSPPAGACTVLGVDPGGRTGSKLAAVDESGNYQDSGLVFIVGEESKPEEALQVMKELIEKHQPKFMAVGNGSASRRIEKAQRSILKQIENPPPMAVVNESGANVYSTSDLGREEFPNLDITVRGAISIARRLQDPLAELVKVDPRSIGVGQYQYDVNQTLLRKKLAEVVESCVNKVGVAVNTASIPLLSHVSGIGPSLARAIVEYRSRNGPFLSRARLMDVKGIGPKCFELCSGFLRIADSDIPLDGSAIHPENYYIVDKIATRLDKKVEELLGNEEVLAALDPNQYVDENTGLDTVQFILDELKRPGCDPRGNFQQVQFRSDVSELEHLEEGMSLEGKISNVTRFGVFVDIGVQQDGLVHISEISNQFIKDPTEVLKVGQIVTVKVIGLDKDRNRISLSMKALMEKPKPKPRKPRGPRRGGAGRGDGKGQPTRSGKKPPPRKPVKMRNMDDLLARFGDPHKKKNK